MFVPSHCCPENVYRPELSCGNTNLELLHPMDHNGLENAAQLSQKRSKSLKTITLPSPLLSGHSSFCSKGQVGRWKEASCALNPHDLPTPATLHFNKSTRNPQGRFTIEHPDQQSGVLESQAEISANSWLSSSTHRELGCDSKAGLQRV